MITDKNGKEIKKGSLVRTPSGISGYVVGKYPEEITGFEGTLTVHTGNGCYCYAAPKTLEVLK